MIVRALLLMSLGALPLLPLARAEAQALPSDGLTGTVTDSSGGAVAGASIVVESSATDFVRVFASGRDGRFTVRGLPPGSYRLIVVATGFASAVSDAAIPADAPVAVTLEPAAVVEEVRVVSAARQEELRQSLSTRVDVVSRERIESTGAETVGEVLRDLPGVLTRRGSETSAQAGQQIQGIDSRQVLVLLDGQPIPSARGVKRGIVNLDRQSTARLERIEVVKGASSALYGSDAIGGVVNLITKDATAPLEVTAALSGGSFGELNARAEGGLRRGPWSAIFVAERHQHDGFDLTPTTFDTTGAPFRRNDLFFKAATRVRDLVDVSALATGYSNRTTGRSNGELGPQEDDIDDDTVSVGLNVGWMLGSAVSMHGRAYLSRYDERSTARLAPPASTALEPGSLDEDVDKLEVSTSALLGRRQQLQGGIEYWNNRYQGLNRIAFDGGVSASTTVGWVQHRLSVSQMLTTTVGARVDHHSTFGTAVSPKVAANLMLTDGLHARASYGGGFRAPDLGQLSYRFLNPSSIYQVIGNPGLDPEYAKSLQIGADWTSRSRRARVGFNLFRNDVDDLIESVSLGVVVTPAQLAAVLEREGLDASLRPVLGRLLFTYKNVSDAVTQGAELDGELALSSQWTVSGAYTKLGARDEVSGRDLTGRHEHQGHVRLSWSLDRIGLRANLRATAYSGWIAARAGSVDTLAPGFTLWDVYASQRILRGLNAYVALDNLTNNQDPDTGVLLASGTPAPIYRPEAGRTARFGVRWSWTR